MRLPHGTIVSRAFLLVYDIDHVVYRKYSATKVPHDKREESKCHGTDIIGGTNDGSLGLQVLEGVMQGVRQSPMPMRVTTVSY